MAKTNKIVSEKRMTKSFLVSSVCREDLIGHFSQKEIDTLTDNEMEYVARKMGDSFCNCCYWDALEAWTRSILKSKER